MNSDTLLTRRQGTRAIVIGLSVVAVAIVAVATSPAAAYLAVLAVAAPFVGARGRVGLFLALAVPLLAMGLLRVQDSDAPQSRATAQVQPE